MRRFSASSFVAALLVLFIADAGQTSDRVEAGDLEAELPRFEFDVSFPDWPAAPVESPATRSDGTRIPAAGFVARPRVDLVRVTKSKRRLELLSGGALVSEYEIALGSQPIGPKRRQGDGRTPEGRYVIDLRKSDSDYHLALRVSYPNSEDRRRAEARGVDPGGSIMIHGLPNGRGLIGSAHTLLDWTEGCIAVTNREIEEIWERVRDGTPIEILP